MTKPLAQTNRDLLFDLHVRLPAVEGTLATLLGQDRERLRQIETLTATNQLLAKRLVAELDRSEYLMRMLGLVMARRSGVRT